MYLFLCVLKPALIGEVVSVQLLSILYSLLGKVYECFPCICTARKSFRSLAAMCDSKSLGYSKKENERQY